MNKVFVIGRDSLPARVSVEAGEVLSWTVLALPGTDADVCAQIDIEGPGASVDVKCLYLCPENEKLNLKFNVRHISGGSISRQLFKGIVGGGARASFDGLIYVRRDAQKTKAYQENHTILLSGTAVSESRPQLEIYADDVECSHGATSGYLDPDELFYMQSRGIPESEARHLQMISFISPILETLDEGMKADIISLL